MINTIRRLLRRPPATASLSMSVSVFPVQRPVSLRDSQPLPRDLSPSGFAFWGHWEDSRWIWMYDDEAWEHHTHWLPADTEVLPVRCYWPGVK